MNNRAFRGFLRASGGVVPLMLSFPFVFSYIRPAEKVASSVSNPVTGTFSSSKPELSEVCSELPLSFEPATWSSRSKTRFISRQNGYGLVVSANEAVFVFGTKQRKSNYHDA